MLTVALVGPDGAGKSTISRALPSELDMPTTCIYMGVNLESSGLVLPTTRLLLTLKRLRGRKPDMVATSDRDVRRPPPRGALRRALGGVRSAARLAIWLSEEWFRQAVAFYHSKVAGRVVIFDRHFFADYYDYDIATNGDRRPLSRRLHGYVLERFYPKPDLVVFLDAPAEVLFARKGEASVEWLARRREQYLRFGELVPNFVRVDATRPAAEVTREVADAIRRFRVAQEQPA